MNLRSRCASTVALLAFLATVQPLDAGLPMAVDGQKLPTLADMVDRVIPGVVNIATTGHVNVPDHPLLNDPLFQRFFDVPANRGKRQKASKSLGSGVVVDAKAGYILTNQHVIDKADVINVTLRDGNTMQAKLIGVDKETDVAVIQVPSKGLKALPFGDSDALRVGDFVVAMGNPFGLGQTVTSGIVSALGRKGLGKGFEDFIQTDASINPGNSGGALVDLSGKLVGINTAILSPGGGKGNVGIGFAIPINMARQVMGQLIEHGQVRRGFFGAQAQNLTPELAKAFGITGNSGAVITRVVINSAAFQAGLRPGDVIIEAHGKPVRQASDLHNVVGLAKVGQSIPMKLIRDRKELELSVVMANPEAEKIKGEKIDPRLKGAIFGIDTEEGEKTQIKVVKVTPNSSAWEAGLRDDDRILSVNKQPVLDFPALAKAVRSDERQMLLNIERGEEKFFVLVR
ncbi:MAG: Do family serine endopeptidase [Magnetococcales bacterium]|nr:Do family serine endopeptidase [Magnetococcales bacterium]